MQFIFPDHPALQYMGRIDWDDPQNPVWVYPCTCVKFRFTGSFIKAELTNHHSWWDNSMGAILDGKQLCYPLEQEGRQTVTLAEGLAEGLHEITFFKRQDGSHYITLHGFFMPEDAVVTPSEQLPTRKLEFYGDSISAGELVEAVDYLGKLDPEHRGEYNNSYYTYAWQTARLLGAQLHDVAQGGVPLISGMGFYHSPEFFGMEHIYDKIEYDPNLGPCKDWDFSRYTPQVVVVAIGQNDSHPVDFMAEDYDGRLAAGWREHYRTFLAALREKYPNAEIIAATTIMAHDPAWDKAIGAVVEAMGDEHIHHFLYKRNGCGTPGHVRIPEGEEMAKELAAYIDSLAVAWEQEA